MEQGTDNRPDLNLSGIGQAAGGAYRNVRIDGICTFVSEVECEAMDINGRAKARGGIKAGRFHCNGTFDIDGALCADETRIDGMVSVNGSVAADRLNINGMFKAEGDLTAENARLHGLFKIRGLLNAGTVEILMFGKSLVREIGGEKIKVASGPTSGWRKLWQWAVPKLIVRLEAETIEGDEIELTDTTAAVVRGNRVTIGKGCRIGKVEYRSDLVVHPQAKVDETIPHEGKIG